MKLKPVLVLPAMLWLSACAWLQGGDSNLEPASELVKFTPRIDLRQAWWHDTGADIEDKYILLRPAVRDDAIYTVDRAGQVTAYNATDGKRRWRVKLKREVSTGLGFAGDVLFVGTQKGEVVALAAQTGATVWEARVPSEVLSPPVSDGKTVVVQTGDGKISALAAADGKTLWLQERNEPSLSLRGTAAPTLIGDKAVVGFANGKLAALKLGDGATSWETTISEARGRDEIERLIDVDAAPVTIDGNIYTGAYQGKWVALASDTGALNWAREISSYHASAHDARNIYLVDANDIVYALDARSGATVWRQDKLRARRLTAPVVFGDYVVVGDFEGYVHFLRKEDGDFAARERVGSDAIKVQPVVRDNLVYILDQGADLTALTLK